MSVNFFYSFVQLLMSEAEANENLSPIYTYSPFTSVEQLLQQFDHIKKTGTRIVIFNLRKDGIATHPFFSTPVIYSFSIISLICFSCFNYPILGNMLEFNFDEDKRDLRIRGDNQVTGTVGAAGRKFQRQRVNQDPTTDIPLDYSLRVFYLFYPPHKNSHYLFRRIAKFYI